MYNPHVMHEYMKQRQQELLKAAENERLAKAAREHKNSFKANAQANARAKERLDRPAKVERQLFYLFISNLSIVFVGIGIFPLLPLYAAEFGATPSIIGVYLSLVYVSITLGTMLTRWLAGRVARRALFVAAGAAGVPALVLLGQATSLWQVIVLTGVIWFTGGVGLSLISVFVSLHAAEGQRGRWFTLISLTSPLGAVFGSLLVGQLMEWQGYPLMFTTMAGVFTIWPLLGLLRLEDRQAPRSVAEKETGRADSRSGNGFRVLLAAALLAAITVSITRLGISLVMDARHFSPAAIAGANVIGGLVTLPVVLGLGTLSDRMGRRLFLIASYVLAAAGGLILIMASQLWHFWLVTAVTLMAHTINGSLAPAMATDILSPQALDRGLPQLNTMYWMAGVLGFAGSGVMMEFFGPNGLFLIAVILSIGAASLLMLLPGKGSQVSRQIWCRLRFTWLSTFMEVKC